jgi:hypothetical protein
MLWNRQNQNNVNWQSRKGHWYQQIMSKHGPLQKKQKQNPSSGYADLYMYWEKTNIYVTTVRREVIAMVWQC